MKNLVTMAIFFVATFAAAACGSGAEAPRASPAPGLVESAAGPRYENGTDLVRPADYREWPFLGSSLGLTYEPVTSSAGSPPAFTNVFVNPYSYMGFMETGVWPDRTLFILEFRRSETEAVPNEGGWFQGGLLGIEAEVKDSRFPDGWGFFNLTSARRRTSPIPPRSSKARRLLRASSAIPSRPRLSARSSSSHYGGSGSGFREGSDSVLLTDGSHVAVDLVIDRPGFLSGEETFQPPDIQLIPRPAAAL